MSYTPVSSFHPVHYGKMKEFFTRRIANETEPNQTAMMSWLTEKVIGVHIWNKLSKTEPIYKNSTQDYTRLARNDCPLIFSIARIPFNGYTIKVCNYQSTKHIHDCLLWRCNNFLTQIRFPS
jgi:hypothetical protein